MTRMITITRKLPLTALIAGLTTVAPHAFAATGAGADEGVAESTVRIPKSNETLGPADSASTVKAPLSQTEIKKKNGFDEVSISAGRESYVDRGQTNYGASEYTEISGRIRKKTEGPVYSAVLDAGASIATDVSSYSNYEVPEAYFKVAPRIDNPKKFVQVSAGRKKERWSGLDSDWSLGLVQPFNKFDALRPTEQGLTGIFAEAGTGPFSAMLFSSPVYIPEQGAPYQLTNGKFTTSSPWFTPPPDSLIMNGSEHPALYTIQMPETSSVINHASVGGRLRIANPSGEGPYAQGTFLRAPQNAVALSFYGNLALRDTTTYGDILIVPEVVYHTLTAADVGYSAKNFTVEMSMLNEVPDQPTLSPGVTSSHYNPMLLLSPSVEFRTFNSKVWGPKFRVSYLDTHGGEVTAIGEYAANGNVFGSRTLYRRAVSTSVESTLYRSATWSLAASGRWIEELNEQGTIFQTDVGASIGDNWRVSAQVDLLGSAQPTSVTDTFIERYRANDRGGIRATYIF